MFFETIFIDLDDTIYPSSSGLWTLIRERIDLYLHEKMGFPTEIISALREKLFLEHGTTMRGLQKLYGIEPQEYLDFVHDVPVFKLLKPNLSLKNFLSNLPVPKYIFTNSDEKHTKRVLCALNLEDEFAGIIDINVMSPYCKPQIPSFEVALRISGNSNPHHCIMIDDSPRNLDVAKALGFWTILVQEDRQSDFESCSIQNIIEFEDLYQKMERSILL